MVEYDQFKLKLEALEKPLNGIKESLNLDYKAT